MKKLFVLFAILYSFQANAANLTDTIGAECGRILFYLSEYDYPENYDTIIKRNKQFEYLEKCLKLYKDNNGNIDTLNKNYFRAKQLYELNILPCDLENEKNKKEVCKELAIYTFMQDIISSSSELYEKYSFIYKHIDSSDAENINYKSSKRSNDLTKEWADIDNSITK